MQDMMLSQRPLRYKASSVVHMIVTVIRILDVLNTAAARLELGDDVSKPSSRKQPGIVTNLDRRATDSWNEN